jgi:glycosyltransferase involved in cell wall biosynthesis
MKISVLIPAYNAAATIGTAVESVLAQTVTPEEILVMDDGSVDDTFRHLEAFQRRIKVFRQSNHGVAHARNVLCEQAKGDVIAFLDADDVWHPEYLRTQLAALKRFAGVAATFTGHVNFRGCGGYSWNEWPKVVDANFKLIAPVHFLKRYNRCPGPFGSPSFCCVPKRLLTQMGKEPFPVKVSGADDFYLMNVLPRYGPVAYTSTPLVAYRETPGSISSNRLKSVELAVNVLELLAESYRSSPECEYVKVFNGAFASKRRLYAKGLMGAGKVFEARVQLKSSLADAGGTISVVKSLVLLFSTYLPMPFHPEWPASRRKQEVAWSVQSNEGNKSQ